MSLAHSQTSENFIKSYGRRIFFDLPRLCNQNPYMAGSYQPGGISHLLEQSIIACKAADRRGKLNDRRKAVVSPKQIALPPIRFKWKRRPTNRIIVRREVVKRFYGIHSIREVMEHPY